MGNFRCLPLFGLILVFFTSSASFADDQKEASKEPKPILSTEATNALATFQVEKGFRVEMVAAEPLVTNPAAIAFDENGRLFVVERREGGSMGRVRLLEDTQGSGEFDSSTVYADNLTWPSAITCYGGGVFVAAGTEILYLKDTKSNGVADVRKVALTGFGTDSTPPRAGRLVNSFAWGLDNRIHGVTAGIGGLVTAVGAGGSEPVSLARSDFSFDPRTLRIFPEAGPAQSGLSFDTDGREFVSDFDHPLRLVMSARRYAERNPFFPRPPELLDVASAATPIFEGGGSRVEGRGAGTSLDTRHPIPGNLTGARSCLVYRGTAFPPAYFENVFVADPTARIVHRFVLRENGLEVVATRAPGEPRSEFLSSADPSFHPEQIALGPEGALYIADSQNGENRGRVYRIVPHSFKLKKSTPLAKATTYELAALLTQNNGWECDTVARLFCERRDPAAPRLLTDMLEHSKLPLARLRALHELDGLGALNESHVVRGLADSDERVREHAVLLSEKFTSNGNVPDSVWEPLRGLAGDPSSRVRYQVAFTLGQCQRPERNRLLTEILRRDFDSAWVRAAVMSSLAEGAGDVFVTLTGSGFTKDPERRQFLRELAIMIGTQGHLAEVTRVMNYLIEAPLDIETLLSLLYALGDGLHRTRSALALMDSQGRLQPIYNQALIGVVNDTLKDSPRIEAIHLVGVMVGVGPYKYSDVADWLTLLFGTGQSQAVQSAAIAALGRYSYPGSAINLIARWPLLTPALRKEAVVALLSRRDNVAAVLSALEDGRIRPSDVPYAQTEFLRTHSDPSIKQRAVKLLGPFSSTRAEVLAQFAPALRLTSSAARGRQIYLERCSACHEPGSAGERLGPDLAGAMTRGKDKILSAIVEPNREVSADYQTFVAETKADETLIGLLVDDNPITITLAQPDSQRVVWPRTNIGALRAQPWSLMPEGLEEDLKPQDMADLLEFVAKGL